MTTQTNNFCSRHIQVSLRDWRGLVRALLRSLRRWARLSISRFDVEMSSLCESKCRLTMTDIRFFRWEIFLKERMSSKTCKSISILHAPLDLYYMNQSPPPNKYCNPHFLAPSPYPLPHPPQHRNSSLFLHHSPPFSQKTKHKTHEIPFPNISFDLLKKELHLSSSETAPNTDRM